LGVPALPFSVCITFRDQADAMYIPRHAAISHFIAIIINEAKSTGVKLVTSSDFSGVTHSLLKNSKEARLFFIAATIYIPAGRLLNCRHQNKSPFKCST
jgi:hypothetical protein